MWQFLFELLLMALFALFLTDQVVLPIFQGRAVFPLFRNRDVQKDIAEARLKRERKELERQRDRAMKEINRKK